MVVRNAPTATTTKDSTYVPLFETPPVDATTAALIEETCGDNSECAYDIAVTGNVDVGRETLDDIEEHKIIVNQTLPSMYSRTSIIQFSIIRTLGYPNAILNFKIQKDSLIFCKIRH